MSTQNKPSKEKRDLLIGIPVTAEERKLFHGMARWHKKTLAQLVRDLLYREEKVSKIRKVA
jgi:hypothetical protein